VALLSAPLEKYKDVMVVLKLSNYAQVMEHLDYETNKVMAVVLIQSVLSNSTMIQFQRRVTPHFPVTMMCSSP
jgi:vacuolar protein sorting-associated protein 35